MKVLVVGGGSGGHVTPAIAVVKEILERKPKAKIEFWTDRKYYKNVVKITTEMEEVRWGQKEEDVLETPKIPGTKVVKEGAYIRVRKITAGKFRRYRNLRFSQYFCDGAKILRDLTFGNIAGFFKFVFGIHQAWFRLRPKSKRPDVVFLKGGYVGLPVGLVAKRLKIPYVIHESDAVPGLTSRLLMKKAAVIATGVPMEGKTEGDSKTGEVADLKTSAESIGADPKYEWVGVPVGTEFTRVSETAKRTLKKGLGFDPEKPLVMITGGSQGAEHINVAMRQILPEMLKFTSVGLIAGRSHYEEMVDLKKYEVWEGAKLQSNFRMWSFSTTMHELLGAADVVISRAGATTIAELAALQKAVILVPFEKLPGDHQTKNARRMEQGGAVQMIVDEKMVKKPDELLEMTRKLIRSPKVREDLARNLSEQNRTDATERLAEILIRVAEK